MRSYEELPEHVKKLSGAGDTARTKNAERVNTLQQMNVSLDVAMPKFEYLLMRLVELDVLTEEQFFQLQLDWENEFSRQLSGIEYQVAEGLRKQQEAQAAAMLVAKKPLLGPNGVPIKRVQLPGT